MINLKRNRIFVICLAVMVVVTSSCVSIRDKESPEDQSAGFTKYKSLSKAFSKDGNATVTLSDDETFDLTDVSIVGRKEIILNDSSLKLTGELSVSEDGVIDIKPGKGHKDGIIDLSDLRFDASQVPDSLQQDLSFIEIRPGVEIEEPKTGNGFRVMEFSDTLTAVVYYPAQLTPDETDPIGENGGQINPTEEVPQSSATSIKLVPYDGGDFSLMLPEGWQIQTMGKYTTFGFRAWDPKNPDYEIFYYGNLGPLNKSEEAKSAWAIYLGNMGYPNAELNYDAPAVTMDNANSVFYKFDALQAMSDKYGAGFSFPALNNLLPQESIQITTALSQITTGEAMMFAGVSGSNGGACGGMFMASLWNTGSSYMDGVDMMPTAALHVAGVVAPVEDFLNVEQILTQSVFSLQFTEEYIQAGIQYSQKTGEAAMESNAARQAIYDKANKAWSDQFRGSGGSTIDNDKLNELNDMLDTIKDTLG